MVLLSHESYQELVLNCKTSNSREQAIDVISRYLLSIKVVLPFERMMGMFVQLKKQ